MFGTVEFDLPIRGPNNRFVDYNLRVAPVCALLTAHRTRLVGTSVDVKHVGHWPDYTADTGNRV
jgi:hypothetical protein